MPTPPRDVAFDGVVAVRESSAAVLCRIRGKELWVPQSQITDDSEVWSAGQRGRLVVTRWLAEQKGLVPRSIAVWRRRSR